MISFIIKQINNIVVDLQNYVWNLIKNISVKRKNDNIDNIETLATLNNNFWSKIIDLIDISGRIKV